MINKNPLEEFRAEIKKECIERGIKPPEKDGIREQELFSRWLEGKTLLNKMKNYEAGKNL